MKTSDSTCSARRPAPFLRDPALWAWVIVALLAIIPATEALSRLRDDAGPASVASRFDDPPAAANGPSS